MLFSLASTNLQAQSWQSGIIVTYDWFRAYGAFPAYTVGQYRLLARPSSVDEGFHLGLWGQRSLGRDARWFIRPELTYSSGPVHTTYENTAPFVYIELDDYRTWNDFVTIGHELRLNRLNTSLSAGRHFGRVYVSAGPVLSYRFRTASERDTFTYRSRIIDAVEASTRRWGLAAQVNAGVELGRVQVGLRYERSVADLSTSLLFDGQRHDFRRYSRLWSLTTAVRLHPWRVAK